MADDSSSGEALYGYVPSRTLGFIFVGVYLATTALHGWQALRSRGWWLLPTVFIAGIAEVVGWAARLKSSYDPSARMPFIIQTSILVLAPTPLVAALFIGFGRIVTRTGSQYSRLKPTLYSKIFLTCDLISLLVQGSGGGMAASATDSDKIKLGSHIILFGLFFQIISMSIFCFLMGEYALRCSQDRPFRKAEYMAHETPFAVDGNVKKLVGGICVATALVYIRSVYRIIEFSQGFDGSLAHNQVTFALFDGTLIALAMFTLNFCHPATLFKAMERSQKSYLLSSQV